jgi:hypothetical protein
MQRKEMPSLEITLYLLGNEINVMEMTMMLLDKVGKGVALMGKCVNRSY